MSALWTALMEGETKESLATMVCELRGQKQAGQAEAHPAAAPAAQHPSPSRSEVLEVAAKIADEFADMFRTEPPPYSDNFWAGANIAKAIRDLKDARPDDTALSPLPAKKGGTVD